jgi:hypothetical protein
MKTTLELPDPLFRRAKSVAAQRGMRSFGKLRALRSESARINGIIKAEFDQVWSQSHGRPPISGDSR